MWLFINGFAHLAEKLKLSVRLNQPKLLSWMKCIAISGIKKLLLALDCC